jgi:K+/H+ antiporter YhaU regulatory subunit KhtT
MEVLLFRALKSANIDDDTAAKVVEALEEHIDMVVGQANKALEAKLDGMKFNMDSMKMSIEAVNKGVDVVGKGVDQMRVWMIIITSIIAIIAVLGGAATAIAPYMK